MKEKKYLFNGPPHLFFPISFYELNNLHKILRRDVTEIEIDLEDKPEIVKIDRRTQTCA